MNEIKLTGTIVQVLPEKSGTSQRGNDWRRASYVMQIESGQYPKHCCFDVLNGKIDEFAIKQGETITVHLNIDSREYQGRWFNSVDAWRVEREESQTPQEQPTQQVQQAQNVFGGSEELPF